jgi:hypothetical protein
MANLLAMVLALLLTGRPDRTGLGVTVGSTRLITVQ